MTDRPIENTPTSSPSLNKPESGTYGEGADLARLKAELPPVDKVGMGAATGGPAPMPQPDVATPALPGGRPVNVPEGVPSAILHSDDPGMAAPAGPQPAPVDPRAAQLTLLQQLADSPEVSEETREWARLVLEALIGP